MRNLLGRLHARRLPELLRIAEAWSVPLYVESKSEVVGALYRAMTDPRAMRDIWDRLDPAERVMLAALTDASDEAVAPTVEELAARLQERADFADQRIIGRLTDQNVRYLASKRDRAGHFIDVLDKAPPAHGGAMGYLRLVAQAFAAIAAAAGLRMRFQVGI